MYDRAQCLRVGGIDLPTRHMWRRRTVPLSPLTLSTEKTELKEDKQASAHVIY